MERDFTSGANFANYLSSFWTQIFQDSEAIVGMANGQSQQLVQLYQDFVESINAVSIHSISPLHKELVYPIFIRQSTFSTGPNRVTYGDGSNYGPQVVGSAFELNRVFQYGGNQKLQSAYYVTLPDTVKSIGSVILNRLHAPSVVMIEGADFTQVDNVVSFREDPFANDLIPKRTVAGDNGSIDQELILWAADVNIEEFQLFQQYGGLFFDRTFSGEYYRMLLEFIFRLYSGGPSLPRLDSFVAAAAGLPVTTEVIETVQSVETFDGKYLVVTDANVYPIDAGLTLRGSIVPGATLAAGNPLTTGTEVFDRYTRPLWWTEVPGLTLTKDFLVTDVSSLGFLNLAGEVTIVGSTTVNGDVHNLCRFYLAGTPADVETFWTEVETRSVASGSYLSEKLWLAAGYQNDDGSADFTHHVYLNPLEFVVSEVLGPNTVVVRFNVTPTSELMTSLMLLRDTLPAYCALLVLLNLNFEESFSFSSSSVSAVDPTSVALVDTQALISGSIQDFDSGNQVLWNAVDSVTGENLTKTAEALSLGICPDILLDDYEVDSSIQESVTAKYEPDC